MGLSFSCCAFRPRLLSSNSSGFLSWVASSPVRLLGLALAHVSIVANRLDIVYPLRIRKPDTFLCRIWLLNLLSSVLFSNFILAS